jgi:hypothetical protein
VPYIRERFMGGARKDQAAAVYLLPARRGITMKRVFKSLV